jgi:antitoxin component of RelBE/YafQ-DinJ toxin-antitoxin module
MANTRISARISADTKAQVEHFAEAHGVKQAHLIEAALLHHLQALRELPADIVIPPQMVVTAEAYDEVAALVRKPRKPSQALLDLMAGMPVEGEP